MCIIIYRPAGAKGQVTKEALQNSARANSDGYGLMWQHEGKLHIWRGGPGRDVAKDWVSRFLALQKYDIPVAAHARWTTHGISAKAMSHPYWVERNHSALMHNGVLNEPEGGLKHWSDTKTFVERVLRKLPEGWETQPHFSWLVHEATKGSKMLIFRRAQAPILIHGKDGHWTDGIWYSNYSYKSYGGSSPMRSSAWDDVDAVSELVSLKDDKPVTSARPYLLKGSGSGISVSYQDREKQLISAFSGTTMKHVPIYRYEDVNLCEDCLTREVGPVAVSLLKELHDPDAQCLLCYGTPPDLSD